MPDDLEDRLRRHEEIIEGLARMFQVQHAMNQRIEGYMERQDVMNERLTAAIERLDSTQARIETLLTRMAQQSENGRDA
jgi:hypothetical protein